VVRLAAKAGWPYLIVDGVNIPTERVAAQFTKKQHWYSGKHYCSAPGLMETSKPGRNTSDARTEEVPRRPA
jgi:hypothetical protein